MRAPLIAGWLCLVVGVVFTLLWPVLLARYSALREHEGTEHLYAREFWILIGGFYVIGIGFLYGGYRLQDKWQAAGVIDPNQIPVPVLSGTTALILFAIYLRVRGRVTTWQMVVLILLSFVVANVLMSLITPVPQLPLVQ